MVMCQQKIVNNSKSRTTVAKCRSRSRSRRRKSSSSKIMRGTRRMKPNAIMNNDCMALHVNIKIILKYNTFSLFISLHFCYLLHDDFVFEHQAAHFHSIVQLRVLKHSCFLEDAFCFCFFTTKILFHFVRRPSPVVGSDLLRTQTAYLEERHKGRCR